ncbi:hypothetical protein PQO03_15565 [Lentisphaera profundi]|uniref:Leucine-rich repeat domain-containing protein n=1 Tax=Lentisphaera profundi TaxID=1658616 RepID=A0ABY7W4T3_9BACT|nr:hypothetical protein [Lentisphaera profundi]WDE99253.1 hypothetical protein PQO03_15565 [Lentisphaera profundi]
MLKMILAILCILTLTLNASQEKLESLGVRFQNQTVIFDEKWKGNSEDLKLLEDLNTMKDLCFSGAKIRDEDVLNLESISWIETLVLRKLTISDLALSNIPSMKKLKQLSIASCTQIQGLGIVELAKSNTITQLHLPHMHLDDKDVAPLEKMTQLEYLSLHSNDITTASIQYLRTLKKLKWLYLKGVKIAPEDCQYIAGLSSLKELSLTFTRLDERHLNILSVLPDLKSLRIRNSNITDKDLYPIANFKALRYLQLRGKGQKYTVTETGLSWLAQNCPHIEFFEKDTSDPELSSPLKKIK